MMMNPSKEKLIANRIKSDVKWTSDMDQGNILSTYVIESQETISAEFVRLLWFTPLFVEWQIERVVSVGGDEAQVRHISDAIRERVMEILGTP